jgi:hypothetical protein
VIHGERIGMTPTDRSSGHPMQFGVPSPTTSTPRH